MVNALFQGMQYDPITGLYYGRARWYSPSLERWISQDPAGYINGADLYQLSLSDPVRYVDPEGLTPGAASAGILGGGSGCCAGYLAAENKLSVDEMETYTRIMALPIALGLVSAGAWAMFFADPELLPVPVVVSVIELADILWAYHEFDEAAAGFAQRQAEINAMYPGCAAVHASVTNLVPGGGLE